MNYFLSKKFALVYIRFHKNKDPIVFQCESLLQYIIFDSTDNRFKSIVYTLQKDFTLNPSNNTRPDFDIIYDQIINDKTQNLSDDHIISYNNSNVFIVKMNYSKDVNPTPTTQQNYVINSTSAGRNYEDLSVSDITGCLTGDFKTLKNVSECYDNNNIFLIISSAETIPSYSLSLESVENENENFKFNCSKTAAANSSVNGNLVKVYCRINGVDGFIPYLQYDINIESKDQKCSNEEYFEVLLNSSSSEHKLTEYKNSVPTVYNIKTSNDSKTIFYYFNNESNPEKLYKKVFDTSDLIFKNHICKYDIDNKRYYSKDNYEAVNDKFNCCNESLNSIIGLKTPIDTNKKKKPSLDIFAVVESSDVNKNSKLVLKTTSEYKLIENIDPNTIQNLFFSKYSEISNLTDAYYVTVIDIKEENNIEVRMNYMFSNKSFSITDEYGFEFLNKTGTNVPSYRILMLNNEIETDEYKIKFFNYDLTSYDCVQSQDGTFYKETDLIAELTGDNLNNCTTRSYDDQNITVTLVYGELCDEAYETKLENNNGDINAKIINGKNTKDINLATGENQHFFCNGKENRTFVFFKVNNSDEDEFKAGLKTIFPSNDILGEIKYSNDSATVVSKNKAFSILAKTTNLESNEEYFVAMSASKFDKSNGITIYYLKNANIFRQPSCYKDQNDGTEYFAVNFTK
ncbi:MAG: hypothetical protein MHPSP_000099 [Paramarteilia canceri]